MNTERLAKLADVIEANPDHFDMDWVVASTGTDGRRYIGTIQHLNEQTAGDPYGMRALAAVDMTQCGTTACIAGWTCHLWAAETDINKDWSANAADILNLTEIEALSLFYGFGLSHSQVVECLRDMAKTGKIPSGWLRRAE